jgi:hypothetical protein
MEKDIKSFRLFQDIVDEKFPVGTPKRKEFDKEFERYSREQNRLDRIFGWMKYIPPRLPKNIDEHGYDYNHWKGLGPLMFLVWRTWVDEGFYGMLDMLTFHYFDDKYVLTFKDIRKMRKELRTLRTAAKNVESFSSEILAKLQGDPMDLLSEDQRQKLHDFVEHADRMRRESELG